SRRTRRRRDRHRHRPARGHGEELPVSRAQPPAAAARDQAGSSSMNVHDREHEQRLQAEAEAAERQQLPPGANPAVNQYRLVLRALRQPPGAALPPDFAARVARRALFAEERGSMEDWMVTVLMLALAAGALFYLQPVLAQVAGVFQVSLPALPWPLLFAAAAAVGVAWLIDQGASRMGFWHR